MSTVVAAGCHHHEFLPFVLFIATAELRGEAESEKCFAFATVVTISLRQAHAHDRDGAAMAMAGLGYWRWRRGGGWRRHHFQSVLAKTPDWTKVSPNHIDSDIIIENK